MSTLLYSDRTATFGTSWVLPVSIAKGEEGKIKVSTVVPPVTREKKNLLSVEVDLLKQGRKNFNSRYYRELKLGQLRALFFSEEFAEKEVLSIINAILADPNVSPRCISLLLKGILKNI
ncbi:hypothetical protein CVD25_10375 [Bacillus canaveralius]|uniref:Spore germination protein N-terminal domain-containing protein n=1 Tax=Bacillus canaveralius TaxID=1403243 RepID=A0A2N5GMA5_9BACI|nr:hypothetical protein [Bacillus canaveralius]PLR82961.1 hypothetical protein CU635_10820 [Bacillus canaveralius]PLR97034.1 hypothetical protein CVD25_10375 [Bacillus canaveralius]